MGNLPKYKIQKPQLGVHNRESEEGIVTKYLCLSFKKGDSYDQTCNLAQDAAAKHRNGSDRLGLAQHARLCARRALQAGEEVIPWLDQPGENPMPQVVANQLEWEKVDSWITPNEQFFSVAHYNWPQIDASQWTLEITGLVQHPMTLDLGRP